MKPAELIQQWRGADIALVSDLLRFLAEQVMESELENGMGIRDASDFKEWLRQLADEADRSVA